MDTINKRERFKRLAELRANRVLKDIHLIGNLSNKNNYLYDDEEVDLIFSAIKKELRKAENKFYNNNRTENIKL